MRARNCIFLAVIPQTSTRGKGRQHVQLKALKSYCFVLITAKQGTSLVKLYFDIAETGTEMPITSSPYTWESVAMERTGCGPGVRTL